MATIIYRTNKKTGTVYAYYSESYRDPVTKQPKSKRTYLGRVDPITKQIIEKAPEGQRNRSKIGVVPPTPEDMEQANKRIAELEERVQELQQKLNDLQAHSMDADSVIRKIKKLVSSLDPDEA